MDRGPIGVSKEMLDYTRITYARDDSNLNYPNILVVRRKGRTIHKSSLCHVIPMISLQVATVYFFALCLMGTVGDIIRIYTEDRFGYIYLHNFGVDIKNLTSIAFSVRAKNDAHVALSKYDDDPSIETYEIVIGGWNNEKSAIRKCSQCRPMAAVNNSPLNGSQFLQFWISWDDDYIRVGNGSAIYFNEMMSWNDPDPHTINYFAVSTGWDSNGTWAFNFVDGEWSDWTTWSGCSNSCGNGTRMRTRRCDNPEPLYGAECNGETEMTENCNNGHCPVNGNWSEWSQWGTCSMSCDKGISRRQRSCDQPEPQYGGLPCDGIDLETKECKERECSINGGWATWFSWGACDVTCSNGLRTRRRQCTNPVPQYGGLECAETDTMSESCFGGYCPVAGSWGMWTSWTSCTTSCEGGQQHHTRKCDSPAPAHGGPKCAGDGIDYRTCNMHRCPVDGLWSTWEAWSACSLSCAGGVQSRLRNCNNPVPEFGGLPCDGDDFDSRDCNEQPCPIEGQWAVWLPWQTCSHSCGRGTRLRNRICDNPAPAHGGEDCTGASNETSSCSEAPCPVDGLWSTWEAWSACSLSCAGGVQFRLRNCNNPVPEYGGLPCDGEDFDNRECNEQPCPIEGQWAEWLPWQTCSHSCGRGTHLRNRICDNPAPAHGGEDCAGASNETSSCSEAPCPVDGLWSTWEAWSACSLSCAGGVQSRLRNCNNPVPEYGGLPCDGEDFDNRECNEQPCPIDGQWAEWLPWQPCTTSCGGGTRYRNRTCDNPAPAHGGEDCASVSNEVDSCSESPCPVHGSWLPWGAWSECSVTCSGGKQRRIRQCLDPIYDGDPCQGSDVEFNPCGDRLCPVNGAWAAWNAWSPCSVTCSNGFRTRLRNCDSPAPASGGHQCDGIPKESEVCREGECPVHGQWSPWGRWSPCSKSCDEGRISRSRSCTSPSPQYGGNPCDGDNVEMTSCTLRQCPGAGAWSSWAGWTACSVTCGWGYTIRQRACDDPAPIHGGEYCPGLREERANCFVMECPVDGSWSVWSPWSQCTASCDGGIRQRARDCSNPTPLHGGLECEGIDWQNMTCMTENCPIDGAWSPWTPWKPCTSDCNGGYTSRNRSCDNPVSVYGGLPCLGYDFANRSCNLQPCDTHRRIVPVVIEPVEAPGAASIGFIGLTFLFTMVGAFVIMDLLTIHRHFNFMRNNLLHCWSRVKGEDPPKRKRKSKRRTTKRKLNRGGSVISNENNVSSNSQGDPERRLAPVIGPDMTSQAALSDVDVRIENERFLSNNINIPHQNDLNKEQRFNTMVRKKLESRYQEVLADGDSVQLQATQL